MLKLINCLRQLRADRFTSGEAVAEKLGISRASVSMTLARAERYGVALERRHGLGYRLQVPIEWLDPAQIAANLPESSLLNVHICESTESTSRTLFETAQHGQALAAEWQSAGRGRLGRKWLGELGGSLLFSLAWTFPEGPAQLMGLPLAVGVALSRALRAEGVQEIGLKWPNDLLLPDGKAGGILIEMQGDAMGPAQVVIGVGINLHSPSDWTETLGQPVACLQKHGLQAGRNALLGRCLVELEQVLLQFSREGLGPFRAEWEALHVWQGCEAEVSTPDGRHIAGKILGIAADGALRLLVDQDERLFYTGDVSLRRKP